MQITGIVRKIDDLGRIVLPKELRKTLNINPGDDFQISIDNEKIILEKYFLLKNNEEELIKMINCFNSDDNKVYLVINNKIVNKDNEQITNKVKDIIITRKQYLNEEINKYIISDNIIEEGKILIAPIVYNSDLLGSFIIINKDSSELIKLSKIIYKLLINILN